MSKVLVLFPDPMLAVLNVARPAMPSIVFGTKQPEDLASIPVPYVMVRLDGSFTPSVPVQNSTIRIAVWHKTEDESLALARILHAVLLSYPGGPEVRSFSPLTGPIPTSDPDTGSPMSSFTVAARLRPTSL